MQEMFYAPPVATTFGYPLLVDLAASLFSQILQRVGIGRDDCKSIKRMQQVKGQYLVGDRAVLKV